MTLEEIYRKVREGIRISREEGLFLLKNAELLDFGGMANEIRFRKNPKQWVTFLLDTNPNYSNVCNVDCIFCAFYRHPGEKDAYRLSSDQLIRKFKEAVAQGITTVLLQGGVDPTIPFEYYLELVERTVKEVPEIYPHFFSTSEIIVMSHVSGLSIRECWKNCGKKDCGLFPAAGLKFFRTV